MEPTPPQPLRILLIEDNPRDADLVLRELRRAGYAPEVTRVENEPDFLAALQARFDLIISDYRLPGFDGMSAVEKVRSQGLDTPFILISGFLGEEAAILSIKRGADDYVLKENLARLAPAVQAGLEAKRLRDEKRAAEEDRKRAYEQMQRMALVQNATLDALPAHIALLDQDGVIVNANAAWRRFAIANGFPGNNQGIGMNYLGVCDAVDGECAGESRITAQGIRQVLRGEIQVFSREYPCHAPNQKRWFRLAVTPLHEGHPGGAVVSHVDITELKNAEADLAEALHREQEARRAAAAASRYYQSLFDHAPGCYLVLHARHWEIASVSDAYLRATHTLREQIVGRKLFEVFPEQPGDPDGRGVGNLRASLERVESLGRSDIMPVQRYPILRPDGNGNGWEERYWSLINTPVPGPDGRISFIILRMEDVTEYVRIKQQNEPSADPIRALESQTGLLEADIILRSRELNQANAELANSQALLRIAGRTAKLGGWRLDLHPQRVVWSDETCAIHDLPPGHEPSLEEAIQYYAPEYRQSVRQDIEDCIASKPGFDFEAELITANGRRIWCRTIGEIVRDDHGHPTRLQGAIQDITSEKQVQAELGRLGQRLSSTLESLTDAFLTLDRDWRFTYLNREAERLLRRERDALLGRVVWDLFPDAADSLFGREYRRAVESMTTVGFEEFYPTLNAWFEVRAYPSEDGLAIHFRDVTARRRDGEQLRLLRTCVSRLNDIVVITKSRPLTGPGPTLLYANEAFEQRTGYSAHEVFDQAPTLLLGPRTDRTTLSRVRDALLRWEPVREEIIVYTRSGQELWLELDVVPVADGGESWTHWVAIGRDITERKQAESVVRISEERFRLLSKATNDAIWDWNLLTDSLWWNEGFETLFGFDRTKIESTIESWTNRIHPEDRDAVLADVHAAIDAGATTWTGEYRYQRIDGTYAFVIDRGYIIHDESGTPVRMIGGMTDLTERKRAEDQLREHAALLDKAKDAILVLDLNHNVHFWNKGAERLYGWTAQEARGRSIQDLLHRDSAAFLTATRITREKGEWVGELDQFSRHGTRLTVEGRWTLIRDEKGAPRSVLAINTDVTEKNRVEAQFLRAQRMESLGTLAGGIAHDLNNVLAPILMSVDLLRFTCTDEESLGILDNVQRCAQRGADMVRQVLTFARGVDGRRVAIHLQRLIAELHKVAQDTFPKNIAIEVSSTREPWPVSGDPTQLHQVFLNLLVNARDAMPQGGTISLRIDNAVLDETYTAMNPGSRSGSFVVVTVKDSGTGIPPEIIDRIFEPFFTTKQVGSGTGLGLSTAQAIVKSHGGFINLYSELGKGTRFRIYLPAETASQLTEDHPADPPALPRGGGEWVLVVDDEEPIRQTVQNTLERFGYRVLLACHGAEAVATYAQRSRDIAVVLTDMAMPVMDGPALIVALKAINPEVPIIASSGLTSNSGIAKVMAAGVNRFAQKPYTAGVILNLVHQAIHEARTGAPKPGTANPKPPA